MWSPNQRPESVQAAVGRRLSLDAASEKPDRPVAASLSPTPFPRPHGIEVFYYGTLSAGGGIKKFWLETGEWQGKAKLFVPVQASHRFWVPDFLRVDHTL